MILKRSLLNFKQSLRRKVRRYLGFMNSFSKTLLKESSAKIIHTIVSMESTLPRKNGTVFRFKKYE